MTNTIATFENTVGVLIRAYFEGTLMKGDCAACAVGNICAAAIGARVVVDLMSHVPSDSRGWAGWDNTWDEPAWMHLFITSEGKQNTAFAFEETSLVDKDDFEEGEWQIAKTGYSPQELARVEYAFETAAPGFTEEAEFAGLMAVVDVLADIHGIDLTTATAAKALFVRA